MIFPFAVPTPVAPIIDASGLLSDAWAVMPIFTNPLTPFVALSIGISLALLVLTVAKRQGKSR